MSQIVDESKSLKLGFIGGGAMATALSRGLVAAKTVAPSDIMISDTSTSQLQSLAAAGMKCTQKNSDVVQAQNVIILAVKPHIVPPVLQEIRDLVTADHLIISIAAGVTINTIEGLLPAKTRVIRVMPNTPCFVSESASAFAAGSNAQPSDKQICKTIFSSVGKILEIDESKLDAVTGLSGSGPAYVFMMIEAMADGGVRMGLPRDVALTLAAQTVYGASKMVLQLEPGQHVAQLKDSVTSPGGTTIAGLHQLEIGAFRASVINAIKAASDRATELSAAAAAKASSPSKL